MYYFSTNFPEITYCYKYFSLVKEKGENYKNILLSMKKLYRFFC